MSILPDGTRCPECGFTLPEDAIVLPVEHVWESSWFPGRAVAWMLGVFAVFGVGAATIVWLALGRPPIRIAGLGGSRIFAAAIAFGAFVQILGWIKDVRALGLRVRFLVVRPYHPVEAWKGRGGKHEPLHPAGRHGRWDFDMTEPSVATLSFPSYSEHRPGPGPFRVLLGPHDFDEVDAVIETAMPGLRVRGARDDR